MQLIKTNLILITVFFTHDNIGYAPDLESFCMSMVLPWFLWSLVTFFVSLFSIPFLPWVTFFIFQIGEYPGNIFHILINSILFCCCSTLFLLLQTEVYWGILKTEELSTDLKFWPLISDFKLFLLNLDLDFFCIFDVKVNIPDFYLMWKRLCILCFKNWWKLNLI